MAFALGGQGGHREEDPGDRDEDGDGAQDVVR